jgi:hypothetical protein
MVTSIVVLILLAGVIGYALGHSVASGNLRWRGLEPDEDA